jgi:hypothetical protein
LLLCQKISPRLTCITFHNIEIFFPKYILLLLLSPDKCDYLIITFEHFWGQTGMIVIYLVIGLGSKIKQDSNLANQSQIQSQLDQWCLTFGTGTKEKNFLLKTWYKVFVEFNVKKFPFDL